MIIYRKVGGKTVRYDTNSKSNNGKIEQRNPKTISELQEIHKHASRNFLISSRKKRK